MSRIKKTFLNARVNFIFYTINLFLSFYSRKFFILSLGTTFLGLTATITNILSFLNLTELGFGTAITFLLFKPLANNKQEEINDILSLLKHYYKKIGFYVVLGGFIIALFFPIIFKNSAIGLPIVYFTFFSFLLISFCEYYFNYLQLVLIADQKNYLKVVYTGSLNVLKVILQIIAISFLKEKIIFFLGLEVLFSLFKIVITNRIIKNEYKWLNPNSNLKLLRDTNKDIRGKTKQIFSHQIAGFILSQTDQLLIFAFTSLSMVTYYTNYTLLLGRIISVIDQFLNSSNASIGNLVATENKIHKKKIFNEILVLRYWIAGIIIFVSYHYIPAIISLWLGANFVLDYNIFILMLVNNYIMIVRQPIDSFLNTSGIYRDTWAPWTEAFINLIISVLAGYYYGIVGILWGTFISLFLIVVIWKPFLLFSDGFKESVSSYWKKIITYLLIFIISFAFFIPINHYFEANYTGIKYLNLLIEFSISSISFSIVYFAFLFFFDKNMQSLSRRILIHLNPRNG